jgi:ribosomal protein S27AE
MHRPKYTAREYEQVLKEKVEKKELKCPRCGNIEDFLVNELGHVFCNKCHEKIRFVRWDDKK